MGYFLAVLLLVGSCGAAARKNGAVAAALAALAALCAIWR
jgi:hypothetical protein